jgi:ABC-type amino acid transport substrate-binding protein
MSAVRFVAFALVFTCLSGGNAIGEDAVSLGKERLVVGTKHSPPFAIKHEDGSWSGISITLWQEISSRLGLVYEFREFDLHGLLEAVQTGEIDLAVGALTVTAERERTMDFTHPFYTTGLGIGVASQGEGSDWTGPVRALFSGPFLKVIAALSLVILGVGIAVWVFERRRNSHFGGGALQGIGAGFWWSAVTMTTVGYGDKAPVTFWGRLVALVWMFAGIIMISSFTAAITTALTVG